jgi:hypothetical protein
MEIDDISDAYDGRRGPPPGKPRHRRQFLPGHDANFSATRAAKSASLAPRLLPSLDVGRV